MRSCAHRRRAAARAGSFSQGARARPSRLPAARTGPAVHHNGPAPDLSRAAILGSSAHGLLENVQKLLSSGSVSAAISLSITAEEFTVQVRARVAALAHARSVRRRAAPHTAQSTARPCWACVCVSDPAARLAWRKRRCLTQPTAGSADPVGAEADHGAPASVKRASPPAAVRPRVHVPCCLRARALCVFAAV